MSVTEDALHKELQRESYFKNLSIMDWLFAVVLVVGTGYAYQLYNYLMDGYEVAILFGTGASLIAIGWWWKATRTFMAAVAAISLLSVTLYAPAVQILIEQGMDSRDAITMLANLDDKANSKFLFKYFLSSTSAIMWMSALFFMATLVYFFHLATRSEYAGKVATAMTWIATTMGFVGLMVRWRESYMISSDVGHIPVSNLYEVFILFSVITALIYLHYESRYKTKTMGGFVLMVISAAVGFLLWYHFNKGAHEISPLVPALQSYWMKIHVPANFIGYGAFALAAMLGMFFLFIEHAKSPKRANQIIAILLIFFITILSFFGSVGAGSFAIVMQNIGYTILVCGGFWIVGFGIVLGMRAIGPDHLPELDMLDDVMHKSIALGFGFFTIATVLGAAWAAEAWGGYWSWDPKETWALIVWLNYAAWLHMRLMKGLRGTPLAWWSVVGLLITTFAFIGVNIFLSGLHAYGEL